MDTDSIAEQVARGVEQAIAKMAVDEYRGGPVDRRVAVHEAGHSVVGWLIGDTALVEVVIGDDGTGYSDNTVPVDPSQFEEYAVVRARLREEHSPVLRRVCARHVVSLLAGQMADDCGGWLACRNDLGQIDRIAEAAVGRRDRDRFVARLRVIARYAVHDAKPLIAGLADLLVDQRRLPGSFVETWLELQPGALELRAYYSRLFEWQPEEGS